jgi:hypothetical protein
VLHCVCVRDVIACVCALLQLSADQRTVRLLAELGARLFEAANALSASTHATSSSASPSTSLATIAAATPNVIIPMQPLTAASLDDNARTECVTDVSLSRVYLCVRCDAWRSAASARSVYVNVLQVSACPGSVLCLCTRVLQVSALKLYLSFESSAPGAGGMRARAPRDFRVRVGVSLIVTTAVL